MKKKHLWRLYPGRYIEQNPCAAGSSHRLPGGDSPELVGTIRSPAARPAGSAQVAGASNHHRQSGGLGHRRQRRKPTAQRRALQKAHKKPSRRTNTQFLQSFLPSALTHRSRLFFAAVWSVGWRWRAVAVITAGARQTQKAHADAPPRPQGASNESVEVPAESQPRMPPELGGPDQTVEVFYVGGVFSCLKFLQAVGGSIPTGRAST